jgi:hypothetical protein
MTEQVFILPGGKRSLDAFLLRLPANFKWKVTVCRYVRKRSDAQNRYLWGIAYKTLEQATGQSAQDWHDYFLGEHNGWEEYELFGKKKIRPMKRSSKMTTMEFMDFVDFIQMRAAEHGIYIPDPNEPMEDAA